MPRNFRTFSEIYLEKILFGWLVFIEFDVTMATNFRLAVFSENGKSLFKMKKITFLTVTFMFLAHNRVPLLVLISFSLEVLGKSRNPK